MNPELVVEITFVAVKDAARRDHRTSGHLPLSPGVLAGGRLYLSGMLGNTAGDGAATPRRKRREMMARIGRTLEAGGHGWGDVGEAFLYVTDIATRESGPGRGGEGRFPAGCPPVSSSAPASSRPTASSS